MSALVHERSMDQLVAGAPSKSQAGVDGGVCLYGGGFVAPLTATGYLTKGGGVASTNAVCGVAEVTVDNTSGSDGDLSVNLLHGVFARPNSGTSALDQSHLFKPCYAEDDQTVRAAGGATYPLAGIVVGFEANGDVQVLCHGGLNYLLSQAALAANLAAITNGLGASLIGVEDAANNFAAAANVEACLADIFVQFAKTTSPGGASLVGLYDTATHWTATTVEALAAEIAVALKTAQGCIEVPLDAFCLAAGTPITAYSSDPTPGLAVVDSKARAIKWGSHATPTALWGSVSVPNDLNDLAPMTLHLLASKSGATLVDATTFTVAAYFQTVGALHDADADCGGVSDAMVGDATAKTVAELTRAIAHGDVPPAPANLSFSFKPTDGTLGTDDIYVHRVWFEYTKKIMTS